jgi:hypothetical protein
MTLCIHRSIDRHSRPPWKTKRDAPELLEGRGAVDGRLVGPSNLVDFVARGDAFVDAVGGANVAGAYGWAEVTKAFDNVVLDEGFACPTVDS